MAVSMQGFPSRGHETGETHEGQGHEAGGDECDGAALEGRGHIRHIHPLANGREQGQHQGEADGGAETVQGRLDEGPLLLQVEQGNPEHRAVGGDEREKDAEDLIQHGTGLVHHGFGELDHGGDDQNEGDGAQILDPQGHQ